MRIRTAVRRVCRFCYIVRKKKRTYVYCTANVRVSGAGRRLGPGNRVGHSRPPSIASLLSPGTAAQAAHPLHHGSSGVRALRGQLVGPTAGRERRGRRCCHLGAGEGEVRGRRGGALRDQVGPNPAAPGARALSRRVAAAQAVPFRERAAARARPAPPPPQRPAPHPVPQSTGGVANGGRVGEPLAGAAVTRADAPPPPPREPV